MPDENENLGLGKWLVTIAFVIIAIVIAAIVGGLVRNYVGDWGVVVGAIWLFFELAGIALWRGWY